MSELKTNKFKVGDKVRRISDAWDDMPLNSEWVVSAVVNVEEIKVTGNPHMEWLSEYFELVEDDKTTTGSKTMYSPLNVQQSGDHYKKKGIQPIEYGFANNLSFPQINIVKYVSRHEDKNGLDDLAKSIHYHFFEALRVYGEEGSDQLRKKVLELLDMKQGEVE